MQKMTNVFIVNISMRKMILEVEYSKRMISEIKKIFRRIVENFAPFTRVSRSTKATLRQSVESIVFNYLASLGSFEFTRYSSCARATLSNMEKNARFHTSIH